MEVVFCFVGVSRSHRLYECALMRSFVKTSIAIVESGKPVLLLLLAARERYLRKAQAFTFSEEVSQPDESRLAVWL